jgi:hypothetical protein
MEFPSFVGSLPRFALSVLKALAVLVLPAYLAAGDLVIAKSGHSSYRIVVPEGATSAIGYAAAELQRFVRDISGATLDIVTERQAGSGPAAGEALEYLALMDRLKDTNGKHYPTNGWDPPEVATPGFVAEGSAILNRGLAKAGDPVYRGRVEKLLLPLWFMQLGWPDRYGLSKEQGRELLARFKTVIQAFHITNESEGPVGNMSRFLADMDAKY